MPLQDLTPQLRTRLSRVERVVGLFVGLALLLLAAGFAYYVYHTAQRKGWLLAHATYFTFVESGDGLKVGDPVKLMGFDVGQITRIDAQPPGDYFNVYVEFELRSPYFGYMWTDSKVKVATADFLGKRVIEVTKGSDGWPAYLFRELREFTVSEARATPDIQLHVFAQEVQGADGHLLASPFDPVTPAKLDALAAGGVQRFRAAEYYHNPRRVAVEAALQWPSYANQVFIDEVTDPATGKVLARIAQPVGRGFLEQMRAAGLQTVRLAERRPERQTISGIWNGVTRSYDFRTNQTQLYWLVADESPALTERAERLVQQVETALPNILALTNQLAAVLSNAVSLTAHADALATNAQPTLTRATELLSSANRTLTNLQPTLAHVEQITALLTNAHGALGQWLLPSNVNTQLELTLSNLNVHLTDTLVHLADLTSNLHAQVEVNTNILSRLSQLVVNTDELVQGLKRHWFLRSAFKAKKP
jgi:ABC-type transporter Mla subunit MlaD